MILLSRRSIPNIRATKKNAVNASRVSGSAINHVKHRNHGDEKLPRGQARIVKPQVESRAEEKKEYNDEHEDQDARVHKCGLVDLVQRVEGGENHHEHDREHTGEDEPTETKPLSAVMRESTEAAGASPSVFALSCPALPVIKTTAIRCRVAVAAARVRFRAELFHLARFYRWTHGAISHRGIEGGCNGRSRAAEIDIASRGTQLPARVRFTACARPSSGGNAFEGWRRRRMDSLISQAGDDYAQRRQTDTSRCTSAPTYAVGADSLA